MLAEPKEPQGITEILVLVVVVVLLLLLMLLLMADTF